MAAFTDPTGGEFGVWQPGENAGLQTVMEPNSLCWTELHTTDAQAAKGFYRSVFSWQYEDMPMGDGMVYTVVSAAGGGKDDDTSQGGIMALPKENVRALLRHRSGTRTSGSRTATPPSRRPPSEVPRP